MPGKKNPEGKKLEARSHYAQFDLDGDGTVTDKELEMARELSAIEIASGKAEGQQAMAWFSLVAMVGSLAMFFTPIISVARVAAIGDLIGLFFISCAGITGAFMGVTAWQKVKATNGGK